MPNGSEDPTDQDRPIPFGVSAETGRPLPGLSDEASTQLSAIEHSARTVTSPRRRQTNRPISPSPTWMTPTTFGNRMGCHLR